MDTFGLKIIASDKVFYDGRCRKLVIPAPDGEEQEAYIWEFVSQLKRSPGRGLRRCIETGMSPKMDCGAGNRLFFRV